MAWKRKGQGGLLAFIGFMLSPLSWWNDAFVNLPLAIGFGWLAARFHKPIFEPAIVVGYWLTNVLGFVLMHKGAQQILTEGERRYTRRDLVRDVGVSLAYTLLIVLLLRQGILQPLQNYFPEK
jgi:hypothetical protein